jgi:hypothetical protein
MGPDVLQVSQYIYPFLGIALFKFSDIILALVDASEVCPILVFISSLKRSL